MTVRSEKIADPGPLHELLPSSSPLAWLRHGEGLIGWGEAARVELTGPDRFAEAERWWQEYLAGVDVQDELTLPGSGPVVLGAFAFADGPTPSTLIVPRVVLGRRDGVAWRTTVGGDQPNGSDAGLAAGAPRPPREVRFDEDASAVAEWHAAVEDAVQAIRGGRLAKAVLALPAQARAAEDVDARHLLVRLLDRYPDCWSFLLDGFVGATPELLVERMGSAVRSRVLAGTLPRIGADSSARHDTSDLGSHLLGSAKDLSEHRLAAEPVAAQLRRFVDLAEVPDGPAVLELPNVVHLATRFTGRLRDEGTTALALAGALHPTPAVAGTPPTEALDLIDQLEGRDRGRYSGPIGWMDARGDGEFCLALRCAEVDGPTVRLYAGCGIVADSDADAEVVEWRAKLRPILDALGS